MKVVTRLTSFFHFWFVGRVGDHSNPPKKAKNKIKLQNWNETDSDPVRMASPLIGDPCHMLDRKTTLSRRSKRTRQTKWGPTKREKRKRELKDGKQNKRHTGST